MAAPNCSHMEQLKLIHRNSLRLLKLVNTLLDFSRIEAGRTHATYEAVDLSLATADLVSIFRSAADRWALASKVHKERGREEGEENKRNIEDID